MKFSIFRLDELAQICYGKNQKQVECVSSNIPILGTGGVMGYANKPIWSKPSVLIGRKGTINKVKYVDYPFWTVDTLFYTRINESLVYPRFFYYLLSVIDFDIFDEGTSIPSLRTETLNSLCFNVVDKHAQKKILDLLEPLEKAIENNEIIKKQISDYSDTVYSHLYNSLDDSSNIRLGELIDVKYGKDHKNLGIGSIPVYGSGGVMRYVDHSLYSGESVLIPRKGTLNNVMYVNETFWTVDTMFYTRMKVHNFAIYLYHYLKHIDMSFFDMGSAVPSMTTNTINSFLIKVPDSKRLRSFNDEVASLYELHKSLTEQNAKISSLKDFIVKEIFKNRNEELLAKLLK